jgi:hypothetical protein
MIPFLLRPTEDGLRHWWNRHWLRSQVLFPSSISISRPSHTGNRYTCRVRNANPVRPLRSTGITRFPRYYEPVRLPTQPTGGYVFPPIAEAIALAAPDLPGSSTDLSARAIPYHPDEPGGFNGSFLPHRRRASPHPEGWPTRKSVTRPNRVRLRYGSRVRSAGLRLDGCPNAPPASLPAERAIDRMISFQIIRSARLRLAHRKALNTRKALPLQFPCIPCIPW